MYELKRIMNKRMFPKVSEIVLLQFQTLSDTRRCPKYTSPFRDIYYLIRKCLKLYFSNFRHFWTHEGVRNIPLHFGTSDLIRKCHEMYFSNFRHFRTHEGVRNIPLHFRTEWCSWWPPVWRSSWSSRLAGQRGV